MLSCGGINGYFPPLCDCAKHTLQYGIWLKATLDFVLTTVRADLDDDATHASFIAAISIPFPLYDRLGDVLLYNRIVLVVSRGRFV